MNGRVGKSCCTQCIYFLLTHCRRICGQLLRVFAQRLIHGGEVRNTPIPGNRIYVGISLSIRCKLVDLGTEVMGVATQSIHTTVSPADHNSQHLPLCPRQRRLAIHDRLV